MDNHIYVHTVPALSADRWFSFHLAFLRWLKLGQLKQQLINTEHPVLPRELGCQSLWLVSCASGSLFYTQPQNSLLLKSGIEKNKNKLASLERPLFQSSKSNIYHMIFSNLGQGNETKAMHRRTRKDLVK